MKKLTLLSAIVLTLNTIIFAQGVGINTSGADADASAMLDVSSTTQGFLPPRMTETQRNAISNPATGLMIYNTTANRPNYYNGTKWLNSDGTSADLVIGETYAGGIIFYIDGTGQHGLVAASSDQSAGIQWYNGSFITTGATGDGIGAGATNTNLIVNTQGAGSYAAQLCNDLTLGGYFDWYLPSKYELNLMYTNLYLAGFGGFFAVDYWSSTEYNNYHAWSQSFSTGWQAHNDEGAAYYVRAVRAF